MSLLELENLLFYKSKSYLNRLLSLRMFFLTEPTNVTSLYRQLTEILASTRRSCIQYFLEMLTTVSPSILPTVLFPQHDP